jgi:hypothetical protein
MQEAALLHFNSRIQKRKDRKKLDDYPGYITINKFVEQNSFGYKTIVRYLNESMPEVFEVEYLKGRKFAPALSPEQQKKFFEYFNTFKDVPPEYIYVSEFTKETGISSNHWDFGKILDKNIQIGTKYFTSVIIHFVLEYVFRQICKRI